MNFHDSAGLDPRLRDRSLHDDEIDRLAPIEPGRREEALASFEGRPAWVGNGKSPVPTYRIAAMPTELAPTESLRSRLRGNRFLRLLPLVDFLRRITGADEWRPPRLRAAFVIDDPNLHWRSYGYVDYRALRAIAESHGFHVAIALVPLDGWFAHREAVRLFAESPSLSLLVHGNNHLRRELDRPMPMAERVALLQQALRRIEKFERKTGLSVSRVLAPPHGACAEDSLRAALQTGFESACISRPEPWRVSRQPGSATVGMSPADHVAGGFPVIPRHKLGDDWDDLVLRAYLNQPLILYGHHADFRDGLDVLASAAANINRLGDVRWCSVGEISRSNFASRTSGDRIDLRLYSRAVTIATGDRSRSLSVDPAMSQADEKDRVLISSHGNGALVSGRVGETSELPEGSDFEVRLAPRASNEGPAGRPPVRAPWPILRRLLVESRDRLIPILDRADRR